MTDRPPVPESTPASQTYGQTAANGAMLLSSQAIVIAGLSAVQGLAAAYLLEPAAFNIVGLAFTVTTFAAVIQNGGWGQILIQRRHRFELWAPVIFWLLVGLSLAAAVVVAVLAPLVASFYNQPELSGVLRVAAVTLPLSALGVVPDARLRSDLRFGRVAVLGVLNAMVICTMTITLAALGWGAYAIIIPPILGWLTILPLSWRWSSVRITRGLNVRRWRYVGGDAANLLVANLSLMGTFQIGPLSLGRFHRPAPGDTGTPMAGYFYFSANLSDQSSRTVVTSLSQVLMPTLSRFAEDRARQLSAFKRAVRVLVMIGPPLVLLQAVLSKPLFETFLPAKWEPAIFVFAILSVGMIGRMIYGPCEALLLSSRRTRTHAIQSFIYAACFVTIVCVGAWKWELLGAAVAFSAGILIYSPIAMTTATRPMGGSLVSSLRIIARPLMAVVVGILPAAAVAWWGEVHLHNHLPQWYLDLTLPRVSAEMSANILTLIAVPLVHAAVYIPLIRTFCRSEWNDLIMMTSPLLRRVLPGFISRRLSAAAA